MHDVSLTLITNSNAHTFTVITSHPVMHDMVDTFLQFHRVEGARGQPVTVPRRDARGKDLLMEMLWLTNDKTTLDMAQVWYTEADRHVTLPYRGLLGFPQSLRCALEHGPSCEEILVEWNAVLTTGTLLRFAPASLHVMLTSASAQTAEELRELLFAGIEDIDAGSNMKELHDHWSCCITDDAALNDVGNALDALDDVAGFDVALCALDGLDEPCSMMWTSPCAQSVAGCA